MAKCLKPGFLCVVFAVGGCGPSKADLVLTYTAERDELGRLEAERNAEMEAASRTPGFPTYDPHAHDDAMAAAAERAEKVGAKWEPRIRTQREKTAAAKKAAGIGLPDEAGAEPSAQQISN